MIFLSVRHVLNHFSYPPSKSKQKAYLGNNGKLRGKCFCRKSAPFYSYITFSFSFFFFFRLGGSISINEYTSTKDCQLPWQANERFQHSSGGFLIYKFHLKLKVKTVCRELYRRRYWTVPCFLRGEGGRECEWGAYLSYIFFCKFNGGFKSVNTVDCNAVNILNGAVFGRWLRLLPMFVLACGF